MSRSNLILVGPMGAGKSTIGRRLSERLGLAFYDSDKVIEERTGADIPLIFDLEGEAGFRRREAAVIGELAGYSGIVLATGGGAVLQQANRQSLRENGFVVYLKTSIEEQLRRTAHDRNRPLLHTADRRARLEALRAEREPLYRDVADLVLETDRRRLQQVVYTIARRYRRATAAATGTLSARHGTMGS